jgi:adenine-specific DNA-methyltransferase
LTTNVLDGLLARVDDPDLREALSAEVARLRDTKEFGLVFERHFPENVSLQSHPIRRGVRVQLRDTAIGDQSWLVSRIKDDQAVLIGANGSEEIRSIAELVVIREFGETIYPGIKQLGSVRRGGERRPHIIFKGENYHVLQTLHYLYEGQVDCIYIDPPYNSGARDWKYNNDYVDENDAYRHSKWLAFMERRLQLAKRLLNPECSVLIVTIDEKEYLRLGLLLEQVFAGHKQQMVSITINPKGTARPKEFSRVDEFAFFVLIGSASVPDVQLGGPPTEVRWRYLRRNDLESVRGSRPRQFYPIYVDDKTSRVAKIGTPLDLGEPLDAAPHLDGCTPVFPIREDGLEMEWGLTGPSLQRALDAGFVRVTRGQHANQPYTFSYLTGPNIKKVDKGELQVTGIREDGSKIVVTVSGTKSRPTTTWREKSHDAGAHGTSLLGALIPGRRFPFPKSLYAVEDTIRLFVKDNPEAVVLDFFGGSGTTTHAIARLNRQDGGRRQSILITNNEVSATEAKALRQKGLRPGDPEWEALGIFEYITRPRITSAITGLTPDGTPIPSTYKFTDESPIADGFEENVAFLELLYLDRNQVSRSKAFENIAPLLWMKAGAVGEMIANESPPFAAPGGARYAVLFDVNYWQEFAAAVRDRNDLKQIFVVTDSLAQYQQVVTELSATVEVSMLYEDYLRNFEIGARGEL